MLSRLFKKKKKIKKNKNKKKKKKKKRKLEEEEAERGREEVPIWRIFLRGRLTLRVVGSVCWLLALAGLAE